MYTYKEITAEERNHILTPLKSRELSFKKNGEKDETYEVSNLRVKIEDTPPNVAQHTVVNIAALKQLTEDKKLLARLDSWARLSTKQKTMLESFMERVEGQEQPLTDAQRRIALEWDETCVP